MNAQRQSQELDILDTKLPWYPVGILGFKVALPIFDGFQKHYRIQQSKLGVVKAQNNVSFIKSSIDIEIASARTGLLNSANSMTAQKKNMELSKRVYEITKKKYEEGIGSNLEVLTAENSMKEAQTNYLTSLYDAVIAKIEFEKATGTGMTGQK